MAESALATESKVFTEHRIPRGSYTLCAREYAGAGPTFVMMHGFPDDQNIYARLGPALADKGYRLITFDFLGYGRSDKPSAFPYTPKAWEDDLGAVVNKFGLDRPILVAHDASGPTTINWALDNPNRVGALALLNTYYGAAPTLRFPDFIAFFADPNHREMAAAVIRDPAIFFWMVTFQGTQFARAIPEEQAVVREWLAPHVQAQFAATPSTATAFRAVTAALHASVAENTHRLNELTTFKQPVSLIWGEADRYLNVGVAEHLKGFFPNAQLKTLKAGHWPQITAPDAVVASLSELAAAVAKA